MFESSIRNTFIIMIEVIVAVIVLGLISTTGKVGIKWERNQQQAQLNQQEMQKIADLKGIADNNLEYTGSEIAEFIGQNEEKYRYSIKIDDTVYDIYRNTEEHERASKIASTRLDRGVFANQFKTEADKLYYIDTELWSPEYIISNIMGDNVYNRYKAVLYVQDPLDETKWLDKNTEGTHYIPEEVIGKVYKIQYEKV